MPLNERSGFRHLIVEIVGPKFDALGFQEVSLKQCMHPEVLFNRGRIWFGASWDFRDRYLEVNLGYLHWFRDVMPRVIVLGDYGSYVSEIKSLEQHEPQFLNKVAETIRNTFDSALNMCEARSDEPLKPSNLNYQKEFYTFLGTEVSKHDLSKYTA